MRRRAVLLLLAALPGTALAQAPFRGVRPGEVLRGRFTQERRLAGFARPLLSSGTFLLAPGRGLIWQTELPFAITTIITTEGLVQEVDGAPTMRLDAARLPFLARLYEVIGGALAGDWQTLDARFSTVRRAGPAGWELALTSRAGGPDPGAPPFRAITLRGAAFLEGAVIERSDEGSDTIVFSDQTITTTELSAGDAARLGARR